MATSRLVSSFSPLRIASIVLAAGCVACDHSPTAIGGPPTGPTATLASIEPAAFLNIGVLDECAAPGGSSRVEVIVTALSAGVTVDSVTLHFLDGTNLGGPTIAYPNADLISRFGGTFVRAGGRRVFSFKHAGHCGRLRPRLVRSEVLLVSPHGPTRRLTATAAF